MLRRFAANKFSNMAEASELSPKASTDDTGDSTDQEYEITADMMVHDIDDETTMDEEELMADKDDFNEDELSELQKEQDMPLEELLALYGYSDEANPEAHVPLDEIKPDPLPPLIDASEIDPPHPAVNPLLDENLLPENTDSPAPPSPDSPLSVPSPGSPRSPPSPRASRDNNFFPENQRITRGLAAAYSYFNLGESSSSSDDEDYSPEDWKKEIQIGPDHQAEVPEMMGPNYQDVPYVKDDKCLWDPKKVSGKELQRYLNAICQIPGLEGIRRDVLRDDEQALYLLLQCNYTVEDAIGKRKSQSNPQAEMALWSEDECRDFESGLRVYGKDFRQIQKNKVMSRTVCEIVQFYYLWKKTERHDAFACQTRLTKKKYAFHPGITDYMDRFLDENESAASSRASSPHNFTSRVRPGNGMIPTTIQSQSQPIAPQPMHTVAAPTAAQSTVVTINVSNTNPVSVSLMRRDHHDNIPSRLSQQQSCVPTSVIVSGPDSGGEPPTKKLKILPSGRPKLINSMLSKPPPLKPIATSGSSAFHSSSLGNVSLPSGSVSSFNVTNSHEHSYLPVHNTPASDSILFTHHK
ncbi:mesoderm induction early response protein 1-like isoform X2 [Oculina patagonica]